MGGVHYREFAPPPALAAHVRCLWVLEAPEDPGAAADPVLPDGCAEIVVHYEGGVERLDAGGVRVLSRHRAAVVGQIEGPLLLRPRGRVGILGVRLRPEGAAALLGVPAADLAGRSLSLEEVLGSRGRRLQEGIVGARSTGERVALASGILAERGAAPPPEPVRAAVRLAEGTGGRASVDRLAGAAGVSGRHLERLFRAQVGLPPKTLSRILRFRSALALLGTRPAAVVAADCGYADQAHLHRDFRDFAGAPPGRLPVDAGGIAEPFNG
jgi:AraC-like DNA-binding protein